MHPEYARVGEAMVNIVMLEVGIGMKRPAFAREPRCQHLTFGWQLERHKRWHYRLPPRKNTSIPALITPMMANAVPKNGIQNEYDPVAA
jgi:hypothetical protein